MSQSLDNGRKARATFTELIFLAAFLAIPGVALAVLSLLVPIFFFAVRCLCCSWRRKDRGGGCWPTAKRKRGLVCSTITILILSLLVFTGSAIVYIYGAESTASVDDFSGALVKNKDTVVASIIGISDALVQAAQKLGNMNQDSLDVVLDLTEEAINMSNEVDDYEQQLKDVFKIVDLAFLIAAGVFMFFGLVLLLATGCKWRSVAIILTLIMPLISVIAWACVGVSFPLTALFADTCNEMIVYQKTPSESTLTEYIPCPDRQTAAESLEEAYKNLNDFATEINKEIAKANTATADALMACQGITSSICDQVRAQAITLDLMCVPFVDCSLNPFASGCTASGLTKYVTSECPYPTADNKVTLPQFQATYQPLACDDDDLVPCRQAGKPIIRTDFLRMVDLAQGASDLIKILPETEDLITCKFVQTTAKDLTDNYCKNCIDALDHLWIGFLLVGFGLFVAWFVLMSAQAHMMKGGEVGTEFGAIPAIPK